MPLQSAELLTEQPPRKKKRWSQKENDLVVKLRGEGMIWNDVAKHVPGRSALSCRLRYQNYLERRSEWNEERKNRLACLYDRYKAKMWAKVSEELQVPWCVAEAMHWQLGETDMARRAGQTPFDARRGGQSSNTWRDAQSQSQESVVYEKRASSPRLSHSSRPPSFKFPGKAAMAIGRPLPLLIAPSVTVIPLSQQQPPHASGSSYMYGYYVLPELQRKPPPLLEPLPGVSQLPTSSAPYLDHGD